MPPRHARPVRRAQQRADHAQVAAPERAAQPRAPSKPALGAKAHRLELAAHRLEEAVRGHLVDRRSRRRRPRPKSSTASGPAQLPAPVCASRPSCSAVTSLWPTQRVPCSTLRAMQLPVDARRAAASGRSRRGVASATPGARVGDAMQRGQPRRVVAGEALVRASATVVDLHLEAERRAAGARRGRSGAAFASTPPACTSSSERHRGSRRRSSSVASPARKSRAASARAASRRSRYRRGARRRNRAAGAAVGSRQHAAVQRRCGGSAGAREQVDHRARGARSSGRRRRTRRA